MLIAGTKIHSDANKNRDYQSRILEIYRALAYFLTEHAYAKNDLAIEFEKNERDFTIHSEQLTEEGFFWVKTNLDKWMRNMDRRKTKPDFNEYRRALEKTLSGR